MRTFLPVGIVMSIRLGGIVERRSDAAGCVNKTKALELFSIGKEIKWAVWDKLFRHDSIENLRFPDQKLHGEDVLFLLEFICNNEVFVYSDLGSYYYYRGNSESYTKQSWNKYRLGLVKFYGTLYERLKQFGLDGSISSAEKKYLECIRSSYRRCIHYGYKKKPYNCAS